MDTTLDKVKLIAGQAYVHLPTLFFYNLGSGMIHFWPKKMYKKLCNSRKAFAFLIKVQIQEESLVAPFFFSPDLNGNIMDVWSYSRYPVTMRQLI
jgi:hypothetical protein